MAKIDKEIYDVIAKNLPAATAGVLKEELEDLIKLREEHEKTIAEAKQYKDWWLKETRLKEEFKRKADDFERHVNELKAREVVLEERELNQALVLLENKLISSHQQQILELVQMVFKGPQYQKTISGYVPVAVEGQAASQYNSYSLPGSVQVGNVDLKEEIKPV